MHRSEFLKELKLTFPELRKEINQEEGLLHFEMDVFKKFTQRSIYDGDREKAQLCFVLASKAYESGSVDLRDAIDVSFVEPMEFHSTKKRNSDWSWQIFPQNLKELYYSFHGKNGI